MSVIALQELVGRAVVSETFAARVLNGHRAEIVREAGLEPDEAAEVMAIKADTLSDFAGAVVAIIEARKPGPRPAWLQDPWISPLPEIHRAGL